MSIKWDELRDRIRKTLINIVGLEEILLAIVDELEKTYDAIHKGYTKPE